MCIVTVSRGSFSGAKAIAEHVATRIETPCVSREILAEAAESAGVSSRTLRQVLDQPPSFFARYSREREAYTVFVRAALYRHATAGSFVYHGHEGHLLLDLPNVLRVRVVAPLRLRMKAVEEERGLTGKAAQRHIARIDAQRAKWTRFLYGVAWGDPLLYDLVVNLEKVEVEEAADRIADLARSERFAWSESLRRRAANEALSWSVRAELAKVPETSNAEIEVDVEDGVVALRGSARDDELRRMVVEAAQRAPGIGELQCEIVTSDEIFKY